MLKLTKPKKKINLNQYSVDRESKKKTSFWKKDNLTRPRVTRHNLVAEYMEGVGCW